MTTVLIGQNDQLQGHKQSNRNMNRNGSSEDFYNTYPESSRVNYTIGIVTDGTNGTPRVGSETRSKNITVKYWKRIA